MKRTFITGLLVWIPLGITLWLLSFIVSLADQTLLILPEALQPVSFLHVDIPDIGRVIARSIGISDFKGGESIGLTPRAELVHRFDDQGKVLTRAS